MSVSNYRCRLYKGCTNFTTLHAIHCVLCSYILDLKEILKLTRYEIITEYKTRRWCCVRLPRRKFIGYSRFILTQSSINISLIKLARQLRCYSLDFELRT